MSLSQLPEASNEEVILSGRPEDEVLLSGPQEEVVTDSDFLSGVYDTVPFAGQHQVIGKVINFESSLSDNFRSRARLFLVFTTLFPLLDNIRSLVRSSTWNPPWETPLRSKVRLWNTFTPWRQLLCWLTPGYVTNHTLWGPIVFSDTFGKLSFTRPRSGRRVSCKLAQSHLPNKVRSCAMHIVLRFMGRNVSDVSLRP